jgi:hypothetical protein
VVQSPASLSTDPDDGVSKGVGRPAVVEGRRAK